MQPLSQEVCPPTTDELAVACFEGVAEHDGAKVACKRFEPLDITPKGTVLVAPGYLGIQPSYENFGHAMALEGWNTLIIRMLRRHQLKNEIHPTHILDPLLLSSQALWAVIKENRTIFGIEEVSAVSHSTGGPTTMKMLDAKPNAVKSVLLVGSAGLDHHSSFSLATKLPGGVLEILRAIPKLDLDRRRAARHLLHYAFQDPFRTAREAIAVSSADINDSIAKARASGVKVGRLQFKADPFFPINNILDSDKLDVDLYREYHDPNAGHLEIILNSRSAASSISEMLENMHTA